MGRKRDGVKHSDLPKYIYWKNGCYRYLAIDQETGKRTKWIKLHKNKNTALAMWNKLAEPVTKITTMNDLFDRYMIEVAPLKSTKSYQNNIVQVRPLKAFFGEMEPTTVTAVHIYGYLERRANLMTGEKITSANLEKALLSHVFAYAIKWGALKDNPCRFVMSLKKKEKETERYVTNEEFWAVHSIAPLVIQLIMELAWITSLRKADLLKVKKSDVTDDGILISISKKRTKKNVILEWTDALKHWHDRTKLIKTKVLSMYLLPSKNGTQYTKDGFATTFYRTVQRALKLGLIKESFSIHDIRAKALTDASEIYGLDFAQQQGAHESKKTTFGYIRKPIKIKSWK